MHDSILSHRYYSSRHTGQHQPSYATSVSRSHAGDRLTPGQSLTLTAVHITLCSRFVLLPTPLSSLVAKYHWLPPIVWFMSGSRA